MSTTTLPAPKSGLIGWVFGHVRFLALLAVLAVAIIGGLVYFGVLGIDQIDAEIRARVYAKFAAAYPQLQIEIDGARLLPGRGIQITGVTIRDPKVKDGEIVYIDEILAACDTSLQELLTHEPHITCVTLRRPKLSITRGADEQWNVAALLPLPKMNRTQCPTTIEGATVVICDPATNPQQPLVLKNLDLSVSPDESPEALRFLPESQSRVPLKITGRLACDHFRSLTLEGWLDPTGGAWAFRGDIEQLVITPALESSLPVAVPTRLLSLHNLHGKLTLGYEVTNQGVRQQNLLPMGEGGRGTRPDEGVASAATGADFIAGLTPSPQPSPTGRGSQQNLLPVGEGSRGTRPDEGVPDAASGADFIAGLTPSPRPSPTGRGSQAFRFALSGKLEDARLDDPRLPHPLTDLSAQVHVDDRGGSLSEISARCGTAKVFMNMTRTGWTSNAPLSLKGHVAQLALDSSLADALSAKHRAAWDRFLPSGAVDIDFDVGFDGQAWQHDVTAKLVNVSVAYEKFPYRVTNAGGKVRSTSRELILETFATAGKQKIICNGHLVDPGPAFTGWLEVFSEGPVPLDERLLTSLDEKSQAIVRSLAPRGDATFRFRVDRPDAEQKPEPYLAVALQDVAIKYAKFPYPLDRISGTILWQHGEWTFEKFSGGNDSAYVLASGYLKRDRQNELQLHLDFHCADVPLDEDLKRALPEKLQALWANLSPSGTLDQVTAAVDFNCDRKLLAIDVNGHKYVRPQAVDTKSITLEPLLFPYRLERVTGSFRYQNGDITIKSFKAEHDRAKLAGDAVCQLNPDGGWSVTINRFHADRVEVDHTLLHALPAKASEMLTRLELRGPLHVMGSGTVTSDGRKPASIKANWDVSLDLENGSLRIGTPLEHVHGGLRLAGTASPQGYSAQGELAVDSVTVHGVQLTQVIGPLAIDSGKLALGAWSQPQPDQRTIQNAAFAPRKTVPRQITAKIFGGSVAADAVVALDDEGAFEVQSSLTDADLAKVASEAAPNRKQLTGKAQGYVKLTGSRKGRHTWNGGGVVRLREADIYELPVMVALLKILSVREPDKTAFNTADLDYRIQGEHIYVDRLDFHGDAVTLKGSGEMDWQRHLNLQFYTMVGRDEVKLPVIRPLLGEASRNLMLITVGGTLDQPQMKREAFPGLNETLQQIFPEARK
jgi:hypothetical protein